MAVTKTDGPDRDSPLNLAEADASKWGATTITLP